MLFLLCGLLICDVVVSNILCSCFFLVWAYIFWHFCAILSALGLCIFSIAANSSRILVTLVAVDLVVCMFFCMHLTRSTAHE